MRLWIGGELDNEVAEQFRIARSEVETAMNRLLSAIDGEEIDEWDVIAIIRNDSSFGERVRFSKRDGMDIRLKMECPLNFEPLVAL